MNLKSSLFFDLGLNDHSPVYVKKENEFKKNKNLNNKWFFSDDYEKQTFERLNNTALNVCVCVVPVFTVCVCVCVVPVFTVCVCVCVCLCACLCVCVCVGGC